jgi:hypothetical protein
MTRLMEFHRQQGHLRAATHRGSTSGGTSSPGLQRRLLLIAREASPHAGHRVRVNRTGWNQSGNRGNRLYRFGSVLVGSQPVQIQNLNLISKKVQNLTKFSKVLQGV